MGLKCKVDLTPRRMHKAADHPANIPFCANTSQLCEQKQVYLSDWAFIEHIPDDGSLDAQGNSLSDAYNNISLL